MSDDQPTRPIPEGAPPSADPSSLKGLTMALGIGPAESGQDPLLGRDIGGVQIVRLIAEGGMGRVYEGKQEKPNRTVAVKVMRPGLTSPSILKRFEYEAEVLGRLQHPGIAHIYSVGVHRMGNASVPYFVMEYIADAKALTKYADEMKLPTRQRLDLFRSACDAVAHGHQKGVIHRDLKPSNILVDATGQPKVIDFGVARATDSDMALTTMQTDVGQLIGTLQYMSPEQFRADPNDIDIRSDVYALGVILYELVAGKMPYDVKKKAIHEVARIVQEDDPTPLSSFNRALKGDVAVIAGKCLEKERSRRYSSASELGSDLGRYLTGEPISASPPGFVDALARLARKHRAAAAAVAGVFAALVVAVIGITIFASWANDARRRAESAEQIALDAEAEAVQKRLQAEAAEVRAKSEREAAERRLYEANLYRVQHLLNENNYALASKILQETIPGPEHTSTPIELRILSSLCDQALITFGGHHFTLDDSILSPDGSRLVTASKDIAQLWETSTGERVAAFEGLTAVAFSPDGTRLATALEDNTAQLRESSTGKLLFVLKGHAKSIRSLVFSPDSARLATGSQDKTARVWEVSTGKQLAALEGNTDTVYRLAFSPDSTRLATEAGGTTWVWDVGTSRQLAVLNHYNYLAFSNNGDHVVTLRHHDKKPHEVALWESTTGKQVAAFRGLTAQVAISPDGTLLATVSEDNIAQLREASTGRQLMVLKGHTKSISSLVFSPDGTRLATGSADKTARVWEVSSGKQLAALEGHSDTVDRLAFSPDSTRLATGSKDRTASVWDISTGSQLVACKGHSRDISYIRFIGDGTRLVTASSFDGSARLWNATMDQHRTLRQDGYAEDLVYSNDGTMLATTSISKVKLWDPMTGRLLARLDRDKGGFHKGSVAFNSESTRLSAISSDGKGARLLDTATLKQYGIFSETEEKSIVKYVALSSDGTRLATCTWNHAARLWDTTTGKQLAALHDADRIAFNRDGSLLATSLWSEHAIRLWDGVTGKLVVKLEGGRPGCAFSPDGVTLASASEKTVRLWHVATGSQTAAIAVPLGTLDGSVAFNPDGTRLATGSRDGIIWLWDLRTLQVSASLYGHEAGLGEFELAFSPDGTRLASGSLNDSKVKLWDVESGKALMTLDVAGFESLAFCPDGTQLATAGSDGTVHLWGSSEAEIDKRIRTVAVIEQTLSDRVTAWLRDGPDAAVAKLNEAKATLTPEEYRVAGNMILSRSAGGAQAADHN